MSQNHDELDVLKEDSKEWHMDQQRKQQMRQTIQQYAQKKQKRQKRQRWMVAGTSVAAAALFAFVTLGIMNDSDDGQQNVAPDHSAEEAETTISPEEFVERAEVEGENGNYTITGPIGFDNGYYDLSYQIGMRSETTIDLSEMTRDESVNDESFTLDISIPESNLPTSGKVYWQVSNDNETASLLLEQFEQASNTAEGLLIEVMSVGEGTIMLEGTEEQTKLTTFRLNPYGISYQMAEWLTPHKVEDGFINHHNGNDSTDINIKIRVSENKTLEEVNADWQSEIDSLGEADLSTYDTALEGTHYADQGEGYVIGELGEDVVVIEYEFPMEAGDGFWPRFELLLETIEKES